LLEFFAANPATLPDLPGKLYESEATRTMDAMLASALVRNDPPLLIRNDPPTFRLTTHWVY
jgi:hypothetical protein